MSEEKKLCPIKISAPGAAKGTMVHIGDYKVPGLVNVSFQHKVGELPVVTLEVYALDGVQIEGESRVLPRVFCPACKERFSQEQQRLHGLAKLAEITAENGE